MYQVKLEQFQGPLETLLQLIEKRKLFINDISLAEVTDDFLDYVRQFDYLPLSQTAHFVLIASTLLLIKSKSLLPSLSLSEEEAGSIEDLEHRLKLYKYFRSLGQRIAHQFGRQPLFLRRKRTPETPAFAPPAELTIDQMHAAATTVVQNLPAPTPTVDQAVVKKVVSLEETISKLAERIRNEIQISFTQFAHTSQQQRAHVVVSFLAMLELVKQNMISVRQHEQFGDITMERTEPSVPDYS